MAKPRLCLWCKEPLVKRANEYGSDFARRRTCSMDHSNALKKSRWAERDRSRAGEKRDRKRDHKAEHAARAAREEAGVQNVHTVNWGAYTDDPDAPAWEPMFRGGSR